MRCHVVQHVWRRHDQPPRIHQTARTRARSPSRTRVAQGQFGVGATKTVGIAVACDRQCVPRLLAQNPFRSAGTRVDASGTTRTLRISSCCTPLWAAATILWGVPRNISVPPTCGVSIGATVARCPRTQSARLSKNPCTSRSLARGGVVSDTLPSSLETRRLNRLARELLRTSTVIGGLPNT